eukprot:gene4637-1735_t
MTPRLAVAAHAVVAAGGGDEGAAEVDGGWHVVVVSFAV